MPHIRRTGCLDEIHLDLQEPCGFFHCILECLVFGGRGPWIPWMPLVGRGMDAGEAAARRRVEDAEALDWPFG